MGYIVAKTGGKTWLLGTNGGPSIMKIQVVDGTTEDEWARDLMGKMLAGLNS